MEAWDDLPEQEYNEPFESNNLIDCALYARVNNDLDPLDCAIEEQGTIIEKAVSELEFCIDCLQNNTLVKNRLVIVKKLLMSNQIQNETNDY